MKLSVSAYRAQASAHKKILNSSYQMLLNYGATCTTSQSQQQTSSLGLPSVKVGNTDLTGRTFLSLRRVLNRLLPITFDISVCQSGLLSIYRKPRATERILLRSFVCFWQMSILAQIEQRKN